MKIIGTKTIGIHRILTTLAAGLCLWLSAAPAQAQDAERRTEPWNDEVIELFATLPVQDGGRVKPLDSLAGLHLLTFNGKRKLETPSGEKLKPTAWLLDCIFFPEQARTYSSFYVRDDAVLTAIGIDTTKGDKKKTDRYSYEELAPGRAKLAQEASRISQIEASAQTSLQSQTLKLAHDLFKFDSLTSLLTPLRWHFSTTGTERLVELYGVEEANLVEVLRGSPALTTMANTVLDEDQVEHAALQKLFRQLESAIDSSQRSLAFLPPPQGAEDSDTWWRMGDVVMASFDGSLPLDAHLDALASLERLEAKKAEPAAFEAELRELHAGLVAQAEARGEYEHVPLEVKLYRFDPFTNSLVFYLLAFLLVCAGLIWPKANWLRYVLWASVGIGLFLATSGIVLRCIIRERPPVVSLYDTILFVTTSGVLLALIAEGFTRLRVALSLAPVFGAAGMFLAMKYELKEVASAGDTMASVVAVLDTNYYLAIHVTTITLGYMGGLLAAVIAHVWIFGQLFGLMGRDKQFFKQVTKLTYGVLCFSLLFSIFGTIMGGVWANDSWGRFWGWDPKENGALLICIWELLILHARMGGYIKDRGFAIMCVLGGVVVSMSWWGVNLLNVGLHSYGFTSGVAMTLYTMWTIEGLVVAASFWDYWMRKGRGLPA